MTDYGDKTSVMAAKSECRKRLRNAPLKVSELMKAGRLFDAGDRFHEWLRQQGRLTALDEIYECEFVTCSRETQVEKFMQTLRTAHTNAIDPSGEFYRGYVVVASDYLRWLKAPGLDEIMSKDRA